MERDLKFSDGEKMIIALLFQILRGEKSQNHMESEDLDVIEDAFYSGHYWAIERKFGCFSSSFPSREEVNEVYDILQMWSHIETSHKSLSDEDRHHLDSYLKKTHKSIQFPGFDGNLESRQYSITHFIISRLGDFAEFDEPKRVINSHSPKLQRYRIMLSKWNQIINRADRYGPLSADEIIQILD